MRTIEYIYNKQNLNEDDRAKLDLAEAVAKQALMATDDEIDSWAEDMPETFGRMMRDFSASYIEIFKRNLGVELQEYLVSFLESDDYPEELPAVEKPETYYYEGEDDELS